MTPRLLRSPRPFRRPPNQRSRRAHTCAVPALGIRGEAPRTGAAEAAHRVPAGAMHAEAGKRLALIHICGRSRKRCRSNASAVPGSAPQVSHLELHAHPPLSPRHTPRLGAPAVLCPLPGLQAPSAPTHLCRRAGQTGSPGWRSPAPGDTGWQMRGTQALGTPHTRPPRRPPLSSSKRPSGICRAGRPHTRPHPNVGNTAPGACLHGGTVIGSPPPTLPWSPLAASVHTALPSRKEHELPRADT